MVYRGGAKAIICVEKTHIYFGSFWSEHKGRGDGSALLAAVCSLADQLQMPIKLGIGPFSVCGGRPVKTAEDLYKFYKRFGFKSMKNSNFRGSPRGMIRFPVLSLPPPKQV